MSKINRASKSAVKLILGIVIVAVIGITILKSWGWI
ncbi:hypothetical protein ABIB54_000782 [Frigoribacterium sp. UYMn621]